MYAYFRRAGRRREDAADLTQAFLVDVMLNRRLIERADAARGRFRAFLLTALKRYLIDDYRRSGDGDGGGAQRAGLPRLIPASPEAIEAVEPREADDALRAFDRQWATAAIDEAVRRLEQSCAHDGMTAHWRVFEGRILRPAQHDCEPESFEDLQRGLGVADAQELYSMLQTMKRKFDRTLRQVVAETVDDPNELSDELRFLREALTTA